jgi:hypothetical protein
MFETLTQILPTITAARAGFSPFLRNWTTAPARQAHSDNIL